MRHRRRLHRKDAKKQKKIIVFSLLAALLCLTVGYAAFSTNVNLTAKGNINTTPDSCFTVLDNGDGTGTITDYDADTCGTKVKIPSKINNLTITKIGDTSGDNQATNVFANKKIEKVILPNTITYIGSYAFYNNRLTSIVFPEGVTYIGSHAFYANSLTGELKLPSKVSYIGNVAFMLNHITKVDIPSSVTNLVGGAFTANDLSGDDRIIYGRNSDGSINYSHINSYAGRDATDFVFPETVIYLETCAFFQVNIQEIEVPSRITYIGAYAFASSGLVNIKLNEGLICIEARAFRGTNLETITIPSTVTTIIDTAFTYNDKLTKIIINKPSNSITGAPWGATNATVNWTGTN